MTIASFDGEYRFLSNFYPATIVYAGVTYPSLEHWYQAMKTTDVERRRRISYLTTASEAKKFGRTTSLRPDWDRIKESVMLHGLRLKFRGHTALARKLIATGSETLVEGNRWHDNFWGICSCSRCHGRGLNHLGLDLMVLRSELQLEEIACSMK